MFLINIKFVTHKCRKVFQNLLIFKYSIFVCLKKILYTSKEYSFIIINRHKLSEMLVASPVQSHTFLIQLTQITILDYQYNFFDSAVNVYKYQ